MMSLGRYFFITIYITAISSCYAQENETGSISGKIFDTKTNEPIFTTVITLLLDSSVIKKTQTNYEGTFNIDSLSVGSYNMKILYVGVKPIEIENITVNAKSKSSLDIGIDLSSLDLKHVEVNWSGGHVSFIDSKGKFHCVKSD